VASLTQTRVVLEDVAQASEHICRVALTPGGTGRVGLELEGHLVDLDAPAARVPWDRVRAVVGSVGPLPGGSRVTVEPGGQVELSGPPAQGVEGAVTALRADRAVLGGALAA
jgi:glutamate--cysteine ligase